MINIMTWLWRQPKSRANYTAEHVNIWARMMRRNLTIKHRLCCVTDVPAGIDPDVKIIPLPDFQAIDNPNWSAAKGLPQCFRRLDMFRADAAKTYGKRFVSMDLDCVVLGNLDDLFTRDAEFMMFKGTSASRPYNGSMLMMDAGARPWVYDEFDPKRAEHASQVYIGSDQAWISYALGWLEMTWGRADGVVHWSRTSWRRADAPKNPRLVFFPGHDKPWNTRAAPGWLVQAYR